MAPAVPVVTTVVSSGTSIASANRRRNRLLLLQGQSNRFRLDSSPDNPSHLFVCSKNHLASTSASCVLLKESHELVAGLALLNELAKFAPPTYGDQPQRFAPNLLLGL